MALWEVDDSTEFGIVGLSTTHEGDVDSTLDEGYISKFKEKPTHEEAFSKLINAGLYIIEPEVMELVPEGEKYDFSKQLFPDVKKEVGQCMQKQSTEFGSMSDIHLNYTKPK